MNGACKDDFNNFYLMGMFVCCYNISTEIYFLQDNQIFFIVLKVIGIHSVSVNYFYYIETIFVELDVYIYT